MDLNNYFTFDSTTSTSLDTYISGEGSFNAPERVYDMQVIPGRNGALAIDERRFENIDVTYPAFIFKQDGTSFESAMADLRSSLMSRNGYKRLTDTYHPDEFRMAIFKTAIEVDPKNINRAGEFDLVFTCKPQRWLVSGEEAVTIGEWGEIDTASGDIVTVENPNGILAVKSLVADIEPIQSGSGTPSPDNVRPISGHTDVVVTVADDYDNPTVSDTYTTALGRTVYGGTLDVTSGVLTVDRAMVDAGTWRWTMYSVSQGNLFRTPDVQNAVLPYDALNLLCSHYPIVKSSLRTDNSVSIGQTGHIDVIDSRYSDAASFKTAMSGVQLVYELATPQTYQLTAQQIDLLLGTNNIWADTGDVTLEYGQNPNVIINPTLFDARPLLVVTGTGNLTVNGVQIAISKTPTTIDCEAMEAYNGTTSRNGDIVLTPNQFPVLKPGSNTITLGAGITKVEITPRWWRI